MARDGRIEVWEGMWLSTFILLPLGIFFTYKAVNDSALFNRDAYTNFFRKLIGRSETRKLEVKEVVMTEVEIPEALSMIDGLIARCNEFMTLYKGRQSYIDYWTQGYNRRELHAISADLEHTVDYISNSRNRIIILKLMELPVMKSLWFYHPTNYKWLGWLCAAMFPIGIPLYIAGTRTQDKLKEEIHHIITTCSELASLLTVDTEDTDN